MPTVSLPVASRAEIPARAARVARWFAVGGLLLVLAGWFGPGAVSAVMLISAGATLLALALAFLGLHIWGQRARSAVCTAISGALEDEGTPCMLVDIATGVTCWRNRAAAARFELDCGMPVASVLGRWLAAPAQRVARLHDRVRACGPVAETLATGDTAFRLDLVPVGGGMILWRLDDRRGDAPHVSDSPSLPMLRVDPAGRVVFANAAFIALSGKVPAHLDDVFPDGVPAPGATIAHGNPEHDQPATAARSVLLTVAAAEGLRELFLVPEPMMPHAPGLRDAGMDALPVGLVRIAPDGRMIEANGEARRLLHLGETECPPLADVVEGLGRPVGDWLADARAGRTLNSPEILCASRACAESFLQVSLRRRETDSGPELLAILSDATEFKALEDKFTQSQKMHAIGQLAGGVAHDFNNLLTAITGHCDLLLLRHDSSDPDYPDLIQIQQNANRAASLVRQLLAFSRKQTLAPELFDVEEALQDLAHLLNRLLGERVTLTLAHAQGLGCIRADRRQFEQVLINLAVNARDAMPLGGEIRIETRAVTLDTELRKGRARIPPGRYAQLVISDEGVGMAPDVLDKVFDPFFTTKRPGEGTGLGLSTAYGIVKQTGGFIFAESAEGQGTVFTLYFAIHDRPEKPEPADVADPAAMATQTARPAQSRPRGVILLVEDEAPVRAFSARALQMQGHHVLEAASGEAALELLADPALKVDLFVTDVVMPGLDGPGWVREARKIRPDVGVIFTSGYAEEQLSMSRARTPNAAFLGKPYSLNELTSLVGEKLG